MCTVGPPCQHASCPPLPNPPTVQGPNPRTPGGLSSPFSYQHPVHTLHLAVCPIHLPAPGPHLACPLSQSTPPFFTPPGQLSCPLGLCGSQLCLQPQSRLVSSVHAGCCWLGVHRTVPPPCRPHHPEWGSCGGQHTVTARSDDAPSTAWLHPSEGAQNPRLL